MEQVSTELEYTEHKYGANDRQRVGVWRYVQQLASRRYWVIFIHGGAWRDPTNTLADFQPPIKHILSLPASTQQQVAGFASIDYRLSAYPSSCQELSKLPANALQNARHPDHITDVRTALSCLESKIHLQNNYILIGHSAGATLAYQVLIYSSDSIRAAFSSLLLPKVQPPPLPAAIIGISGIYDLVSFEERHKHISAYRSFIQGAFGEDKSNWVEASPARYAKGFNSCGWSGYSLLAHSPEDDLVDSVETMVMATKLHKDGVEVDVDYDLSGSHDLVWQEGSQVASLLARVIRRLGATE